MTETITLLTGTLQGVLTSSVAVLAIFIGFCVLLGFTKTKRTAGNTPVIKSLDETISHRAFDYLPPNAPRGPADQLKAPDLLEKAAH